MPSYYPVYLDLRGRRCIVVGGRVEAERKAQELLESGTNVIYSENAPMSRNENVGD